MCLVYRTMDKDLSYIILIRALLSLLVFFGLSVDAVANQLDENASSVTNTNSTAYDTQLQSLAQHPQWLKLLHYKPGYFSDAIYSQVDDDAFFVSPNGKYDAYLELKHFLHALESSQNNDDINQKLHCRFPARVNWLKQQLQLTNINSPCPALEQWKSTINAEGASLIFPASYLNSPSSMYGHTFLRLDQKGQNENNRLLAYSVNFAAVSDETDNEIVFSWKGLTGGYPGRISVVPYYEKVNEYTAMENRSVWEFKLDLTKPQVEQLTNHLWEIMNVRFDYFFIDENCAYRILSIIDIATDDLNTANAFRYYAIPTDTIRELDKAGILLKATYRPSDAEILASQQQQLSEDERHRTRALLQTPYSDIDTILAGLGSASSRSVLESAYQLSRYQAKKQKGSLVTINKRSLQLLSKRSKLSLGSPFSPPVTPAARDDQGHQTSRLGLMAGTEDNSSYQQLSARLAYHDLLDPVDGYIRGAQIEMLDISIRRKQKNWRLQSLELLNIRSMTARNDFFQPVSWHVSAGWERQPRIETPSLGFYLTSGGGASYRWGDSLYGFVTLDGSLRQGSDLDKGWAAGLGPATGLGWQGKRQQWLLQAHYYDFVAGQSYSEGTLSAQWAYNINRNLQLRLSAEHTDFEQRTSKAAHLGLHWYY